MAGEGIIDISICYLVINLLINKVLPIIIGLDIAKKEIAIFFVCLGIMIVPVYYCTKWLRMIFGDETKEKEESKK